MLPESGIRRTLAVLALLTGVLCCLMLVFLVQEGAQAWATLGFGELLSSSRWYPLEGRYGMLAMVVGSLVVTVGALLVAVPLGIGSGVFSVYCAPPVLSGVYRRLVEIMAGIPSVIFGFWGLVHVVPLINRVHPPGASVLAGSIVLGLMILPTVALVTEQALREVPRAQIDGALALGMGPWSMILHVALPTARRGIAAGVILQTGRAIGETMVVLMVCGNVVDMPTSLFDPVRTLTANIALEMSYAIGLHRSALFAGGSLLMVLVVGLALAAHVFPERDSRAAR